MEKYYRDTVIEINLDNILNNINEIKDKCAQSKYFYAIIKGDAYGHGLKQVADIVIESKADAVGVATLDEALLLRKYHKDIKILCLGIIPFDMFDTAAQNDITITLANFESLKALQETKLSKQLLVHFKANVSMNRIGFSTQEDLERAIILLKDDEMVKLEGLFTHFATAEDEDKQDILKHNINTFKELVTNIDYDFEQYHCTNSATLLKYCDELDFTNACRAGIALYGALDDDIQDHYNIKSALSLKSKITQVQKLPKGTSISYSFLYTTKNDDEIIATIPIGYADGFSKLHTGSLVKCNDQYGVIVGSICMDQLMIRFDEMVKVGDEIYLIADDTNISLSKRSLESKVINHEILTRFTARIPKLYYRNNKLIEVDNAILKK